MKVLHLFSGSGSMDQAFKDRGHVVFRIDIERSYSPDMTADIGKLRVSDIPFYDPDVILGGFPCETFSVASISTHWTGGIRAYVPKTLKAENAMKLVNHTRELINEFNPRISIIENPRGIARKIWPDWLSTTVWYCRYWGEKDVVNGQLIRSAKPTDLFGKLPEKFVSKTCHNNYTDHVQARRGAKTGTQGKKNYYERSKVPYKLSLELCLAVEKQLEG